MTFLSTLPNLRARLEADAALAAWFAEHYPGLPVRHLIGLRPDPDTETAVPADYFPYIALSRLTQKKEARPSRRREWKVSILFGLNDDRQEDGVYLGVRGIDELTELILDALEPQPIGTDPPVVWSGEADTRNDAGTNHPYYEGEIVIPVTLQVKP